MMGGLQRSCSQHGEAPGQPASANVLVLDALVLDALEERQQLDAIAPARSRGE
jgi:hypothetical protein